MFAIIGGLVNNVIGSQNETKDYYKNRSQNLFESQELEKKLTFLIHYFPLILLVLIIIFISFKK